MESEQGSEPAPELAGFAEAFAAALSARGATLTWLGEQLRARGSSVSLGGLSYWRSGSRRPEGPASLETVARIEELLGLRRGELVGRLGPSRRPMPPAPGVGPGESVPHPMPVREAVQELGLKDVYSTFNQESSQLTMDVDEHGRFTCATQRVVLRALVDGARSWFVYAFGGVPLPEPIVLERVSGARAVQEVTRPEVGLHAWRVEVSHTLRRGELAVIETVMCLVDPGDPDTYSYLHVDRRLSRGLLWVRFDRARLPSRCWEIVEPAGGKEVVTEFDVAGRDAVHVSARNFGPGRLGLRWEW